MTDEKLQAIIGNLLRAGVLASSGVVGAGGLAYLLLHHADRVAYGAFKMQSSDLRTISGILHFAVHLHPGGIIQAGIVLMIATPVARVALAAIGFLLENDRLYLTVSLIVLGILIFSIAHA